MKYTSPLSALLFLTLFSFSQKTDENYAPTQYKAFACQSSFPKIRLEGENYTESVQQYLRKNITNLNDEQVGLKLNYINESPGGIHYSFSQTFKGIVIYQSEIKVNIDRKNIIRSVFDNSENTSNWNLNVAEANENSVVAINPETGRVAMAEKKIEDQFFETLRVSGEIIYQRDIRSYCAAPDSLVSAKVFNPDPLATAQQFYDTNTVYRDNNDSNAFWMDAQYKTVNFRVKFQNSTFILEDSFVRVKDFDTPFYAPATSSIPEFYFDRSQSGFEDVNAFYHISVMQKHVRAYGFNCADGLVEIDPHGLIGDNSYFYPGNPNRIIYGVGGVDDAEDADVCIHEYGHSISETASPGSNFSGLERNGLDEGFGDYLAASYSKNISSFNEFWIMNWDGHNEYWGGRVVNSATVYPPPGGSSIYKYGSIWASALYAIHNEIGRAATDSLILETHYNYASGITMRNGAQLLIESDTTLFNGKYFCVIYKHLLVRNLVDFNPDYLICLLNSGLQNLYDLNVQIVQDGTSFTLINGDEQKLELRIFNISGQVVDATNTNQRILQYHNEELAVGIYLISLQTKDATKTFKWCKGR